MQTPTSVGASGDGDTRSGPQLSGGERPQFYDVSVALASLRLIIAWAFECSLIFQWRDLIASQNQFPPEFPYQIAASLAFSKGDTLYRCTDLLWSEFDLCSIDHLQKFVPCDVGGDWA
jgi:hypothetical protein